MVFPKHIVIAFMLLAFVKYQLAAQNLLPDGGFEILQPSDCLHPEDAFDASPYWYTLQATPDLFAGNCAYDPSENIFWTPDLGPAEGKNFAGLRCRVNAATTYVSEAIATSLSAPLEAGTLYYFELQIRNKGFYQGFPNSVIDCPLTPYKHLDIYTSVEPIEVLNDFSNGTATSTGTLVRELSDPFIQSDLASEEWMTVASCFEARGGEQHLAIMQPLGSFGEFPPCAQDDMQGTFYSYYFDIDAAVLQPMPGSFSTSLLMLPDQPLEVDMSTLFDFPLMPFADYIWADGYEGITRSLSQPGRYEIDAVFDCGSVPVVLEVELIDNEQARIFAPNAFSPNGDEANESFEVIVAEPGQVVSWQLMVFNRWGQAVFESTDPATGWNGRQGGQELSTGVYLWFLSVELDGPGGRRNFFKSGDVLLLR